MPYKVIVGFFMLGLVILYQCNMHTGSIYIAEKPHQKLSDYHFFQGNLSDLNPNEGVIPYDLNTPLFSDYAQKARFVYVPPGQKANFSMDHVLDFPVGTVLIKNFYYHNDDQKPEAGRKILETRLLINRGDEWEAVGYIWDEDQKDAVYQLVGDIKKVKWKNADGQDQDISYIIPNKNQCKNCHAYDGKQMPIGPKVRNQNKEYTYADGPSNQLFKWQQIGILSSLPNNAEMPKTPNWEEPQIPLHDRAMAYLDMNCGHCHNPRGAANTSGLTLTYGASVGTTLGIYKPTVSAGAGTGGFTYLIVPGHPEE